MFRAKVFFFILTIIVSFSHKLSASNFADTYGFSAYGMSMGNAMTAIVNDWSSVWYNIAGLGRTTHMLDKGGEKKGTDAGKSLKIGAPGEMKSRKGLHPNEFFVSYFYSHSMHTLDGVSQDKENEALDQLDIGIIILGMALNVKNMFKMPDVISSFRFGFGVGVMHDGALIKVNDINPGTPNFTRYGREAEKAMILTGIGMGFLDDMFGFGIGVNFTIKGKGKVNLSDIMIQSGSQESKSEIKLNLSISPTAIAGFYFSPGKIAKIIKGLHFGASYRMESEVRVSPFDAENTLQIGGVTMDLGMQIIDFYSPHIVTAGVAYTILDMITLSLDFEYQLWSLYEFHGSHELGNISELLDVWIPRFGVNYEVLNFMGISAGYYYQPSMISDEMASGLTNILDNDKHVVSLGLNFKVPQLKLTGGPIVVDISYQLQYLAERDVEKDAGSYHATWNPNYSYGGVVHTVMVSVGMRI